MSSLALNLCCSRVASVSISALGEEEALRSLILEFSMLLVSQRHGSLRSGDRGSLRLPGACSGEHELHRGYVRPAQACRTRPRTPQWILWQRIS